MEYNKIEHLISDVINIAETISFDLDLIFKKY